MRTPAPEIWSPVPAAVTGNAFVGDTFAAAVEAWLLDQRDAVDVREPLYVLELGAGTGMFSHLFVTAIARRCANGTFPHPRVVLVLCDQSEMRFDAWAETNVLAKHVRAGAIDFATLSVDERGTFEPIVLKYTGASLAAPVNPLVVVANYFFDSIPTDAFRVRRGKLFEARTRFVRISDAPGFEGFQNEEQIVEVGAARYGDALLDGVLAGYARDFAEASVLMPIAGIRVVNALQKLSVGRLLLLGLDKGITTRGRVEGWFDQPFVAHSGVFSYLVNFDAMRRWFEAKGGFAICARARTIARSSPSRACFPDPRRRHAICSAISSIRSIRSTLSTHSLRSRMGSTSCPSSRKRRASGRCSICSRECAGIPTRSRRSRTLPTT